MPAETSLKTPLDYRRILLRADGSASIGIGHVVRSLVLARELLDLGAQVEVWGSSVGAAKMLAPSFQPLVVRDRAAPDGTAEELNSISRFKPDLVIVDGYHFRRDFFLGLSAGAIAYGVIDDNGETQASSPVFVVNQNPSASENQYRSRFPFQRLFLGTTWALIRQEFRMLQHLKVGSEHDIYLALGGSDVSGLTLLIAERLVKEGFSIAVALGPVVPDRAKVTRRLRELPGIHLAGVADAPLTMAKSDLLVLGAGSALWEANALGKKSVGLVVAKNQAAPAKLAHSEGLVSTVIDVQQENDREKLPSMLLKTINALKHEEPPRRQIDADSSRELAKHLVGLHNLANWE